MQRSAGLSVANAGTLLRLEENALCIRGRKKDPLFVTEQAASAGDGEEPVDRLAAHARVDSYPALLRRRRHWRLCVTIHGLVFGCLSLLSALLPILALLDAFGPGGRQVR